MDDIDVLVEVGTTRVVGTQQTSVGERMQQNVVDSFERAQDTIVAVSTKVAATVRRLVAAGARPDRVEVEFGLKFTAKGDVIVASGSGEVALKVMVGYDPDRAAATTAPGQPDEDQNQVHDEAGRTP
ncbi:CU044_2847 family protein [Luedemannella helvata]